MIGNLTQGTNRALYEQVTFNKNQVTSVDWVTYPILRFADAPKLTTVLVQRARPAVTRFGRARHLPVRRRNRERVVRRYGRARPHRAVDPGSRPGHAQGCGRQLAVRLTVSSFHESGPGIPGPELSELA
jgi:hypothetical protein